MRARTPRNGRWTVRRRLLAAGVLAVVLLGGAGLWVGLHRASTDAPATAATHLAPEPQISDEPAPSNPSLATTAPSQVPAAVLADDPQLPANMPAVGLGQASDYANGVSARLVSITSTDATARGRGEISGPALAVAVELTNGGSSPVTLDAIGVNAYSGPDGAPAARMLDGATQPLQGTLEAGRSMTAVYVFAVPTAQRDSLTVTVSQGAGRDATTAVFSGSAS
jgi:hypothetical protein